MRVALVSPYDLDVPGGVQSHVEHLADELRRLGDEVAVLGPGEAAGPLSIGRGTGVPFNGSVAPIGLGPAAAPAVRRLLARLGPDVIHVHEPLVPFVGIAAATSRLAPVVATFHAWSDTDRLYRLARPVGRALLRAVDVAVAVSPAAAAYHGGALGVPPGRFALVPNGVDVARFAAATPLPRLAADDRPTLLFLGRLERRKGLEVMLRAFVRLAGDHPRLRLVVVGDGPERRLIDTVVPAELRDDVLDLGRVAAQDLPRCYAAADVYVSPALGGESFGIVLLEAMAAGRPVVASDLPGYRSVVTGDAGVLSPPGDAAALAAAIAPLLGDPARRRAMGEEGRRIAAAHDWPVVATRLRGHYLDAVAGRRRGRVGRGRDG